MATFIAIVQGNGDHGYTASFPDFPDCSVRASTLDQAIANAREALLAHIEHLLQVKQTICNPTAVDAIDRGDALLLAAVDVPDDLGIVHIDVAIPALSPARIDSFVQRCGLTRAALFDEAVRRWAAQAAQPRERREGISDGPTLFDFANPLELRVEKIAASMDPHDQPAVREGSSGKKFNSHGDTDEITAELARLLGERSEPGPIDEAMENVRNSSIRKTE